MSRDEIRRRISDYRSKTKRLTIDEDSPSVVVDTPVNVGKGGVLNPSEVESIEDLPSLPPRLRDFAFDYATSKKRYATWAQQYGVTENTIGQWIRNPGVQAVVAVVRYQRRMWQFAMSQRVEREAYKALLDVLQSARTSDNIPTIQRAAEYVMNALHGSSGRTPAPAIDQPETDMGGPYSGNQRTVRDVKELREDIQELDDMYEDIVGKGDDE